MPESSGPDGARTFAQRHARKRSKKTRSIRGLQLRPPNTGSNQVESVDVDDTMLMQTNA
jgi:hypothetical protein